MQAVPAFQGQSVHVTRSVSGPATTLDARWNGESVSIDIVVCLKADDVEKRFVSKLGIFKSIPKLITLEFPKMLSQ